MIKLSNLIPEKIMSKYWTFRTELLRKYYIPFKYVKAINACISTYREETEGVYNHTTNSRLHMVLSYGQENKRYNVVLHLGNQIPFVSKYKTETCENNYAFVLSSERFEEYSLFDKIECINMLFKEIDLEETDKTMHSKYVSKEVKGSQIFACPRLLSPVTHRLFHCICKETIEECKKILDAKYGVGRL